MKALRMSCKGYEVTHFAILCGMNGTRCTFELHPSTLPQKGTTHKRMKRWGENSFIVQFQYGTFLVRTSTNHVNIYKFDTCLLVCVFVWVENKMKDICLSC